MMRPQLTSLSCLALAALFGCGGEADDATSDGPIASIEEAVESMGKLPNGTLTNGTLPSGTLPSGTLPSGALAGTATLGSISLSGAVDANGDAVTLSFSGSRLRAYKWVMAFPVPVLVEVPLVGVKLKGTWVDGAGNISNASGTTGGAVLTVTSMGTASSVTPNPQAVYDQPNGGLKTMRERGGDVYQYSLTFQGTNKVTYPLCGYGTDLFGTMNKGTMIAGKWDYRQGVVGYGGPVASSSAVTFSCRSGAIDKCVELGYAPWRTDCNGALTLQDSHTACVRALRADHCGNGVSLTRSGMYIDIFDAVPIQTTQSVAGYTREANWNANGSSDLDGMRVVYVPDILSCGQTLSDYIAANCPKDNHPRPMQTCGTLNSGYTLLETHFTANAGYAMSDHSEPCAFNTP